MNNPRQGKEQKPQPKQKPLLPLWGNPGLGSYREEECSNGNEESRQKTPRIAKPLLPIGQMPELP
jgi:hypothetical protein